MSAGYATPPDVLSQGTNDSQASSQDLAINAPAADAGNDPDERTFRPGAAG